MPRPEKTEMKCKHCGYEWVTLSTKENVSCPNCLLKTPKPPVDLSEYIEIPIPEEPVTKDIECEQKENISEGKENENVRETYRGGGE